MDGSAKKSRGPLGWNAGMDPAVRDGGGSMQGGRKMSGAEKVRNSVEHSRGTSLLVHEAGQGV